ncbi:hypothetical protein Tco_1242209 [Tanacetum coccineum]
MIYGLKKQTKTNTTTKQITPWLLIPIEEYLITYLMREGEKLIHPLSGSTTSSSFDSFLSLTSFETSDFLLEEFVDELAHVDSFLSEKVDDLFDFEDNNDEWRNILYHNPFDDIQSDDDDDLFYLKSDNDE